jgi:hypothetical protein
MMMQASPALAGARVRVAARRSTVRKQLSQMKTNSPHGFPAAATLPGAA